MLEKFMELVNACGNDADLDYWSDGTYYLILNDLEGFDRNWREVEREYDNEEAVNALLDWLEANYVERDADFYIRYTFLDFQLLLGYASFDI